MKISRPLVILVMLFSSSLTLARPPKGSIATVLMYNRSPMQGAMGLGAAAMVEFMLAKPVGIELGAFALFRTFLPNEWVVLTPSQVTPDNKAKWLHLPGVMRFHLGPYISVGGGAYYDWGLDAYLESHYGATGNIRFDVPVKSQTYFGEVRYNHGLKAMSNGNFSEIMFLFGVTFGKNK